MRFPKLLTALDLDETIADCNHDHEGECEASLEPVCHPEAELIASYVRWHGKPVLLLACAECDKTTGIEVARGESN